jgi:CAAX protease family protein
MRGGSLHAPVTLAGVALLVVFPHLGLLQIYAYPWPGLLLCWALLRWDHKTFADIGFRWRAIGWRPLLVGGGMGLAFALFNYLVIGPAVARVLGTMPDVSQFTFVRGPWAGYLLMLALSWLVGGLYEEIVFRGVVFSTLHDCLSYSRFRFALAALFTSVVFAAYHVQLGTFGVVNAFVTALALSALQARHRQNLWYVICFHAASDMFALTLIRYGYL